MVQSPVQHPDYYQILGVDRDATVDTIKAAFHKLARRYHPDRSNDPDAEARFKQITEAYAVLSDESRRSEYDTERWRLCYDRRAADHIGHRGYGRLFTFGPDVEENFLHRSFVWPEARGAPGKGADIRLEIEVSLDAIASGAEQTVEYGRLFRCPTCGGRGIRPGASLRLCTACGGAGRRVGANQNPDASRAPIMACERCDGTGLIVDEQCPECSGSGLCPGREWLKVRIPPGVDDGTVLRVRGRGLPGRMPGGEAGDLYLTVRSAPDPHLVRSGADLWLRASVPVADAVLGVHLDVTCPGQVVGVEVPPGTQPGTVLRLAGHGLPRPGSPARGQNGDLCVVINVVVPSELSDEERSHYEQLRGTGRRSRRWPWRRRPRSSSKAEAGAVTP